MTRTGVVVIRQRKSWDCGIAALAMLLDVPYGDVSAVVRRIVEQPKRKGLLLYHLEAVSRELGYPLRRIYRKQDYLENATGILGLNGGQMDKHGHWVVIKGGSIVDPDGGEVWNGLDYLKRFKARPATLLVREDA